MIVDHLRVDVIERAINAQPRTRGRAQDALAHAAMDLPAVGVTRKLANRFRSHSFSLRLSLAFVAVTAERRDPGLCGGLGGASLARFLLQAFARQADALLLVRIRRTQAADIRRHLPDLARSAPLTVRRRLLFHRDLNAFGNRELDGMRIAERENDGLALDFGAIADADDVEILLEALR